jgi:hypothetical protein
MEPNSVLIQGLWVGQHLPTMQQLSISSFLAKGHEYHLYAYSDLDHLPKGAFLKDARQILPESDVFLNAKQATYAAFSDYFRYKLLLTKGGWWADTDVICLRPFLFEDEYVFSSENSFCRDRTNSGVIKAPQGAPIMEYAWDVCRKKDKTNLSWDEVGPDLMEESVQRFSLDHYVRPPISFCPLHSEQWRCVLEPWKPSRRFRFQRNTFAIHLWHEMWRRNDVNVDLAYPPDSLYEQLKALYLLRKPVESIELL